MRKIKWIVDVLEKCVPNLVLSVLDGQRMQGYQVAIFRFPNPQPKYEVGLISTMVINQGLLWTSSVAMSLVLSSECIFCLRLT